MSTNALPPIPAFPKFNGQPSGMAFDARTTFQKLASKIAAFFRVIAPSSWMEFILFVLVAGLILLLIQLARYASIQREVRGKSRCYKERANFRRNSLYTVNAVDGMDIPLYNVEYNTGARDFTFNCACPTGKTVNLFKDVRVYDMKSKEKKSMEKSCVCDKDYTSQNQPVFFQGYPGLVRFMSNGDEQFFKQDI